MSPETRELEAFFQDINDPPPPAEEAGEGAASPADDFDMGSDSFFRKLSALDDLDFGVDEGEEDDSPPPLPEPPPVAGAAPAPDAPAPRTSRFAPKAPPRAAARSAPRSSHRPATPASPPTARRNRGALALAVLKVTAIGALLFALGLGAGWLVLSLPKTLERAPRPAVQAARPAATAPATAAQRTAASPRRAEAEEDTALPEPLNDLPVVELPRAVGPDAPDPVEAAPETPAAVKPAPQPPASRANPAAAEAGAAATVAQPAPSAAAQHTAPEAPAAPLAPAAPAPAGDYALQVGACRSAACVESYRARLLPHVSAERIQVIDMPAAANGASFQRIRIAPLSRADAEALKARLGTADRAFRSAYVVTP